ncbi:MAG: hypothetical protein HY560_04705, partial [Gemmatimonadetes bacterium]|nr:hypothetical protein [Gemmatimonadota bacterium]
AREAVAGYAWTYRFPHAVELIAASTLGETMAAFLEAAWSRERGAELGQAKLKFQDPLPWIPKRRLNLWLGLQNLYLFTLANRQIDRAGRQTFLWEDFRISDIELREAATGEALRSSNDFKVSGAHSALDLNGLVTRRLYYGVGLAQGAGAGTTDNNSRKDVYYKLRYKLGGLRLDGTYAPGAGPMLGGRGQLLDRSLILEHFGYLGAEPVGEDRQDGHRSFGLSARVLYGRADLGIGYVWGRNDDPWGRGRADVRHSSVFGKAEYLIYPWLVGSFKFEVFDLASPIGVPSGFTAARLDQTRLLPGFVFLVRQNIRGVLELELFTEHAPSAELGRPVPRNLWFRLDVAF